MRADVGVRGTTALGRWGLLLGARASYQLAPLFAVGLAGYITGVRPTLAGAAYRNERYLRFYYGGPEAHLALLSSERLLVELSLLAGIGGVGHNSSRSGDVYVGTDLFWLLEPGLRTWLRARSGLEVGFGISHRSAYGVELARSFWPGGAPASNALVDGINVEVTARLGLF